MPFVVSIVGGLEYQHRVIRTGQRDAEADAYGLALSLVGMDSDKLDIVSNPAEHPEDAVFVVQTGGRDVVVVSRIDESEGARL